MDKQDELKMGHTPLAVTLPAASAPSLLVNQLPFQTLSSYVRNNN